MIIKLYNDVRQGKVIPDYWRWRCPKCNGIYSHSKEIAERFGIPNGKVYCACCNILYIYSKQIGVILNTPPEYKPNTFWENLIKYFKKL